jgi:hypothetical protein
MKQRMNLRAIAAFYIARSKRHTNRTERQRLAKAAEHYRELPELEEAVAAIRPKPPDPSI